LTFPTYNFFVPFRSLLWITLFSLGCQEASLDNEVLNKREATPVTVLKVSTRELPITVQGKGKTEPSDRFKAKAPEGGGRVKEVLVETGQRVDPGDPLALFEEEMLRAKLDVARAQIAEAEAGLEEIRVTGRTPERKPEGEEEPLTPLEKTGEEQEEGEETAQARNARYEATRERAKKEIELFEKQLDRLKVLSPIAGVVTEKNATAGSELKEGDPLMEVVRIDPIWFTFEVPLQAAGGFRTGDSVPVRFSELSKGEVTGEVLMVGLEAGKEGGVKIKVKIPNEDYRIKGGIGGEVATDTVLKKPVVTVPNAALIRTERSVYLFKVIGDRARKVPIKIEGEAGGDPIIIKGVDVGDQIVISDLKELKDGTLVEIAANPPQ